MRAIVALPEALGGVSGAMDVLVAPNGNVNVGAISVGVGNAMIGPMRVQDLAFDYSRTTDYYNGEATLSLPTYNPYALRIGMILEDGALSNIRGEVSGLNVPVGYGAYLQRVGADVTVSPHVALGGTIGFSAGPMLSVNGQELQAAALGGSLSVAFPGTYRIGGSEVYVPYTRVEARGVPLTANAGTIPLQIPSLVPEQAIKVVGSGAPPDVVLRGPHGAVIKTSDNPAVGDLKSDYAVLREVSENTTLVVLHQPVGGTWYLAPLAGSAPITSVEEAQGLPPRRGHSPGDRYRLRAHFAMGRPSRTGPSCHLRRGGPGGQHGDRDHGEPSGAA